MYFNATHFLHTDSMPLGILANMFRQNLSTGLLQVYISPDEQMDCLFFEGEAMNAFHTRREQTLRLSKTELQPAMHSMTNSKAQAINLSPHGLRLYKAFIEGCSNGQTFPEKTENITERIAEWQTAAEPTFAALHWASADALVYLTGKTSFIRQAIFVTPDTVESDIYPIINTWTEPDCSITVYRYDANTPAQTELFLQLTFNHLAGYLMSRYRDIGGRSLLDALSIEFNDRALAKNIDISAYGGSIIDKQFFQSAETAAPTYKSSLELITRHMEAVIGPALLHKALKEGLENSEKFMVTMTQMWKLLPENYLAPLAEGR